MKGERICALYSRGPHYVRMLRCLRENFPQATLVAAIPASFPFDAIEELVDETLRLTESRKPRSPRGAWSILRHIQQAKCSHLVVMFDSPRLNMLSAFSRIPNPHCFTVDGRFYRLNRGWALPLGTALRQEIGGRWNYLQAWWGTSRSR